MRYIHKIFIGITLLNILFTTLSNAQLPGCNLVFSAEGGENLRLTLDGQGINPTPQGQVRIDNVAPGTHKVRIDIAAPSYVSQLNQNIYLDPGKEYYYNVKLKKQREYVLRLYNVLPLSPPPGPAPAPQPAPQPMPVPDYVGPVGCPMPMPAPQFEQAVATIASKGFEETKLTVAKQIISSNCLLSNQVWEIMLLFAFEETRLDLAMFAYGYTFDINNYYVVNNAFNFEASVQKLDQYIRSLPPRPGPTPQPQPNPYIPPTPAPNPNQYNGPMGCPVPMSGAQFQQAKASIASKGFEDTKLTLAKQIISTNCLLSSDVKEILLLFGFEKTRLDFAKFAYTYTHDLANYYIVNDAFSFESSVRELDTYIRSLPPPPPPPNPGPQPFGPNNNPGPRTRPSNNGSPNNSVPTNNPSNNNTNNNAPAGCAPMEASAATQAKNTIRAKTTEASRMAVVKQILAANCLYANDVKDITGLFSTESNRLEFAKLAYPRTVDPNNFFIVNSAFRTSGSPAELEEFIRNYRR